MSTSGGSSAPDGKENVQGGGASGEGGKNGARRTMADITRLFMNGVAPGDNKRPQRISPRARAVRFEDAPVAPASSRLSEPDESPAIASDALCDSQPAPEATAAVPSPISEAPTQAPASVHHEPSTFPAVQILINATQNNRESIVRAAQGMADARRCAVGLIAPCDDSIALWCLESAAAGSSSVPSLHDALSTGAPVDVQLARVLFALRCGVGAWLIAPPVPRHGSLEPAAAKFLEASPNWLLACGADNNGLIAAYRALKTACSAAPSQENRRAGLLVLDASRADTINAHARLNHVAQGFLDHQLQLLELVNTVSPDHSSLPQPLARFATGGAVMEQAAWLSVLDFVYDCTAPAEEAAEMDSEIAELPTPAAVPPPRAPLSIPASPVAMRSPASDVGPVDGNGHAHIPKHARHASNGQSNGHASNGTAAPKTPALQQSSLALHMHLSTLRAVDAPAHSPTRQQLWSLAQVSIGGLRAGATVIDAVPPQHDAALLAVDTRGALHLWILADAANPTAWSAAWQWTQAHRQLIALTQRGCATAARVPVNAAADVRAHIVLPPGAPPPAYFSAADVAFRWYRCEEITWGEEGRKGLIVVPCHAT